jgi:hypothetical protein
VADPAVVWVLRASLALLFAAAAFHKLRAPRGFAVTLEAYALLPRALVSAFAWALAGAEVVLAAALLVPGLGAKPAAGGALLLLVYSGAIGANLLRGRTDIDCGCLGPAARQPLSPWLLARNGVLVVGCLALLAPVSSRPLVWADAVSIVGATLGLALCWSAAHHLATPGLLRRSP